MPVKGPILKRQEMLHFRTESKLIDASGKRVASQAANVWRIANTQALLARYDKVHWDEMEKLLQFLSDEHKSKAQDLVHEGKLISNNSIRCALDAADTAARAINTSVLLRRDAWLRISGFKPEVQASILNTPFDKQHLFGPLVDTLLEKMKKDTEVAKSMGALQPSSGRGSFRRAFYRGGSKNASSDTAPTSYKGNNQPSASKGFFREGYRGNNARGRGSNIRASPSNTKQ